MARRGRRLPVLCAVAVVGAVLVAVGVRWGGDPDGGGTPATTVRAPGTAENAGSRVPDTTSSTAAPQPRTVTTLSAALGPGAARLVGAVVGPEGPVPGATVRIERLFGDVVTPTTVTTDGSGQWSLGEINGGRYRVRAWRPPDLAALEATVFFLTATETKNVGLTMGRHGGESLVTSLSPERLVQGQPATLVVTLSAASIDAEGVLRTTARPNVGVQLAPGPGLVLESAAAAVTDGAGRAVFAVRCTAAGSQPGASAVIAGATRAISLPSCAPG